MDRNLGATSNTDAASRGDLYQWGRASDGHQIRTSLITNGPVANDSEGDNFITINHLDWLNIQNDTRWNGDAKGDHDPCPIGFRVPTATELTAERSAFPSDNAAGALASLLKLPAAGNRNGRDGGVYQTGNRGYYWSSTVSGTLAVYLYFDQSSTGIWDGYRSYGYSVRCIQE